MDQLYVYEFVKGKSIRRRAKKVNCLKCKKEKLVRLDKEYKFCKRCRLSGEGNPMSGKIPHNKGNKTYNGKEFKKSYYQNKRKDNRAKAIEYLGNECWRCKEKNLPICCWDIHHLDRNSKEIAVSQLLAYSWETVKKELIKCVLVCAHCHRIIHNGEDRLDEIINSS